MNIILGISSSIAIYKSCLLLRKLLGEGHQVQVIMTKNATKLISPKIFSALSGREVFVDLFSMAGTGIEHIDLARWAEVLLVAPATANIIGKFASGIADDFLSTYYLAHRKKVLIAPAMNSYMWENPVVQENIKNLKKRGNIIIKPIRGELACGEKGVGKMAEPEEIYEPKIYKGKKVLITAGATREYIDPVRFISNPSSGKMGYALAKVAKSMGAEVLLLSGKTFLKPPKGVETKYFESTEELYKLMKENIEGKDFVFMAAAVGDFKAPFSREKIKRQKNLKLMLEPTEDIIKSIRKEFKGFIFGFALETENLEERGKEKMKSKGLDGIFVNGTSAFEKDENEGILIFKNHIKNISKKEKEKVAEEILKEVGKVAKLA
ncbi:MAG: bifunctional phosphopantothenoylcysteine decarboxylase/phosphopantothenate--cysteine ligase CoaBC [Thermoanaerobaculia bacterium]